MKTIQRYSNKYEQMCRDKAKPKKVLHLVLKAKYFHRIYKGTKKQEYREQSVHWDRRLKGKHHTHIKFQLAYSKNPPTMLVKILDRNIIERNDEFVYCFELGLISEVKNYRPPTDTDHKTP